MITRSPLLYWTFLLLAVLALRPSMATAQNEDAPMSGEYTVGEGGDFDTVADAIEALRPRSAGGSTFFPYQGDVTLIVKEGVYNQQIDVPWLQVTNYQTAPHTLTIRGETGNPEDVTFRVGSSNMAYVVRFNINTRNVVFEDMTIESTAFATHTVHLEGQNVRFSNMIFRGREMTRGDHSRGLRIENSQFFGGGITILGAARSSGAANIEIIGNTFEGGRISINSPTGRFEIRDNVLNATTSNAAILIQNAPRVAVEGEIGFIANNYVRLESGSTLEALHLHTVDSVTVYHNTLKSISPGRALRVTNAGRIALRNNILYSDRGRVVELSVAGAVDSDHNVLHTTGSVVARVGSEDFEDLESYVRASGQEANSIFADPDFDQDADDYWTRKRPRSAALAGVATNLSEQVPTDLQGNDRGSEPTPGALEISTVPSNVIETEVLPSAILLDGNYPNPFNPQTVIRYGLTSGGSVTIRVFDALGRQVAVPLDNGARTAGWHETMFEAGSLPSGMYIYRIETEVESRSGRMLLLK